MLDYKTIVTQYYALHMSGREIASGLGVSKSGVNDFLNAFRACETLGYPLPNGITNYGIFEQVYGSCSAPSGETGGFTVPDYVSVSTEMNRKNMTLVFLWGRYKNQCIADGTSVRVGRLGPLTGREQRAISGRIKRASCMQMI